MLNRLAVSMRAPLALDLDDLGTPFPLYRMSNGILKDFGLKASPCSCAPLHEHPGGSDPLTLSQSLVVLAVLS